MDNWTHKISGFDRIANQLRHVKTLYHRHEITFDIGKGQKGLDNQSSTQMERVIGIQPYTWYRGRLAARDKPV